MSQDDIIAEKREMETDMKLDATTSLDDLALSSIGETMDAFDKWLNKRAIIKEEHDILIQDSRYVAIIADRVKQLEDEDDILDIPQSFFDDIKPSFRSDVYKITNELAEMLVNKNADFS